jgi:cell division protein FtsB
MTLSASVRTWLRRLTLAALLVGALAYLPWRVWRSDGFVKWRKLGSEAQELERSNEALRLKNRALRREIRRLRDDLDAVGQVARDEMGLVGADDLVISIPPPAPKTEEAP